MRETASYLFDSVHICAAFYQQPRRINSILNSCGDVKRRFFVDCGFAVYRSPEAEENFDDVGLTCLYCQVKGCKSALKNIRLDVLLTARDLTFVIMSTFSPLFRTCLMMST